MTIEILTGDCRDVLKELPAGRFNTCVTSPPYYGLRDYGTGKWEAGDPACSHKPDDTPEARGIESSSLAGGKKHTGHKQEGFKGVCPRCGAVRVDKQIGMETTPEEFVDSLVQVFREVRRVLRDDGTLWLNLGDSYARAGGTPGGGNRELMHLEGKQRRMGKIPEGSGLKNKDLIGIPWRVAFALQADGWYLRQDIIWNKPNPMPESVTDRCTKAHEYIFLLSKSEKYYFDNKAILEPCSPNTHTRLSQDIQNQIGSARAHGGKKSIMKAVGRKSVPDGTRAQTFGRIKNNESFDAAMAIMPENRNKRSVWTVSTKPYKGAHFATFPHDLIEPCILAGAPEDGWVLDPFGGAGTTGMVADRHRRNALLVELNPEYAKLAENRPPPDNRRLI